MINIRRVAAASAAAATVATVAFIGATPASAGYSAVEYCTGLNGTITYSRGLTGTAKTQQAVLTGTLTGCSGYNGAQAGTGTITALLSGASKVGSVVETGNATINWPASSGLNPSNAKLTLRQSTSDGPILVQGQVASGAFTNSVLSSSLQPVSHTGTGTKAHPLKAQSVVNTTPFAAKVNFG